MKETKPKIQLKEGNAAPDFTGTTQQGEMIKLSDYKGKVILYFYPKDDTPGCTTEACGIRDVYGQMRQAGITVLGVSPDDADSHKAFAFKYDLPFTLVADTSHEIAERYGVWVEKNLYGRKVKGIARTTFLIDKGIIKKIFEKVDVEGHAQQILAAFTSAL